MCNLIGSIDGANAPSSYMSIGDSQSENNNFVRSIIKRGVNTKH